MDVVNEQAAGRDSADYLADAGEDETVPEFSPTPVGPEIDYTDYVNGLVTEVPKIPLPELRRLRDAILTAITIRSEGGA